MAENSAISWTNHTFNPWIGCTRVSPACDGCYAATLMGGEGGRFNRAQWGGPGKGEGTRDRTKDWRKPRKWNREAADAPGQTFVFCASLADVFDNAVPAAWRLDLFNLIRETPNLTWLLLTKRPGMIMKLFKPIAAAELGPYADEEGVRSAWPRNAAIGCSVVNQAEAERDVPKLLEAKALLNPAFAFLSMEPLLGPVDLTRLALPGDDNEFIDALRGDWFVEWPHGPRRGSGPLGQRIDWVITGGETDQGKHRARPASIQWYRELREQCAAAGTPFHFKQWGEWQPAELHRSEEPGLFAFGDYSHDRASFHEVDHYPRQFTMFGARCVLERRGSKNDPCTLDGVKHAARPVIAARTA